MVTLDTVSVAVAALLAPPAPLQTSEYEVVALTAAVGWVPPVGKVPVQPLDAVQEVALLEVQVSVDVSPGATTEGLTTNVAVGMRLTTVLALAVPPEPVQDNEYEVALDTGPVLWLPLSTSEPLQPPDAVQEVALLEVHVRIDDAPAATAAGDAVNVTVGWGRMFTTATTGAVTPPGPRHVSAYTVVAVNGPVLWLPLVASVPLQPREAVHEVALTELQVMTAAPPETIDVGAAESTAVGGGINITVAVDGAEAPPPPEQTMEKFVVAVIGAVFWLPLAASMPLQPPDAVHESAFAELHVNVELPPTATAAGVAARVTVGTGITVMATVTVWLVPPGPVQVSE
jgi:hypothetical protein